MTKIKNIAQCKKCLDIIESKYTHDFVNCTCGAISLDGGNDYCRMIGSIEDFILKEKDFIQYDPEKVTSVSRIEIKYRHLHDQVHELGNYLMKNFDKDIGSEGGACAISIKLLKRYKPLRATVKKLNEIGYEKIKA